MDPRELNEWQRQAIVKQMADRMMSIEAATFAFADPKATKRVLEDMKKTIDAIRDNRSREEQVDANWSRAKGPTQ